MNKLLFCITMILGITSCTKAPPLTIPPQASDEKPEENAVDNGAFPSDWSIEEIVNATHPSAVSSDTHVLAWQRREDDRPLLVEECLMLSRFDEDNWQLLSLYRHPDGKGNAEWHKSAMHLGPSDDDPTGHWEWHRQRYDKRPTNKEVYDFMDRYNWRLDVDKGWKLLAGAVCKKTWEAVLNEKPTRDFEK